MTGKKHRGKQSNKHTHSCMQVFTATYYVLNNRNTAANRKSAPTLLMRTVKLGKEKIRKSQINIQHASRGS